MLHPETMARVRQIKHAVDKLHAGTVHEDLLRIIDRPGWTTPAEALFFDTLTRTLISHLHTVEQLHERVTAAARLTGGTTRCAREEGRAVRA